MLRHPLTNFQIQKYYQNEPKVNGVYSKNSLPKIKAGAYVINLDEFKSIGTHWIALHVNSNNPPGMRGRSNVSHRSRRHTPW